MMPIYDVLFVKKKDNDAHLWKLKQNKNYRTKRYFQTVHIFKKYFKKKENTALLALKCAIVIFFWLDHWKGNGRHLLKH